MSLIRKHGAVLQAWACLDLVKLCGRWLCITSACTPIYRDTCFLVPQTDRQTDRQTIVSYIAVSCRQVAASHFRC